MGCEIHSNMHLQHHLYLSAANALNATNANSSSKTVYPQAHEMSAKHSAEAMKAEKWQFEYKNLSDKYETLLKEREVRH